MSNPNVENGLDLSSTSSTASVPSVTIVTYIFIAVPLAICMTISIYFIKGFVVRYLNRQAERKAAEEANQSSQAVATEGRAYDIESGAKNEGNTSTKLPSLEIVSPTSTGPSTISSPISSQNSPVKVVSPTSPSSPSFFNWLRSSSPRTTVSSSSSTPSTPGAHSPVDSNNQSMYKLSLLNWIGKQSVRQTSPFSQNTEFDRNTKTERQRVDPYRQELQYDEDVEFNLPSVEAIRDSLSDKSKKNSKKIKLFTYSDKKNKDKVILKIYFSFFSLFLSIF